MNLPSGSAVTSVNATPLRRGMTAHPLCFLLKEEKWARGIVAHGFVSSVVCVSVTIAKSAPELMRCWWTRVGLSVLTMF